MFHLDFRLDLSGNHPLASVGYRRSGRGAAEMEVVERFSADHDIPADGCWFHRKRLSEESLSQWLALLESGVQKELFAVGDLWIVEVSEDQRASLHQVVLSHSANAYLQKVGAHHILSTFDYPLVSPELAEFLERSELRGFELSPATSHRAFREFRPLVSLGNSPDHPSLDLTKIPNKNDRVLAVQFTQMHAEFLATRPLYNRASILASQSFCGYVTFPLRVESALIPSATFDFAYLRQRSIELVLSRRAVEMLRAQHFLSDLETRPVDIVNERRSAQGTWPPPRPFRPPELLPAPPAPTWSLDEAISVTEKWLVGQSRPPAPASVDDITEINRIAGRPIPAEFARFLKRLGLNIFLPNCTVLFVPEYFQRDLNFEREMSAECLPGITPDRLLPLGSVGNGDIYVMKLDPAKERIEAVLLLDHEIQAPVDYYPGLAALLQGMLGGVTGLESDEMKL